MSVMGAQKGHGCINLLPGEFPPPEPGSCEFPKNTNKYSSIDQELLEETKQADVKVFSLEPPTSGHRGQRSPPADAQSEGLNQNLRGSLKHFNVFNHNPLGFYLFTKRSEIKQ